MARGERTVTLGWQDDNNTFVHLRGLGQFAKDFNILGFSN